MADPKVGGTTLPKFTLPQQTTGNNSPSQDPVKMLQDLLQSLKDNKKNKEAGKSGGGGGADEKKENELLELLQKLLSGKITPAEMSKLAQLLGMKLGDVGKANGAGEGDGAKDIKGG